MGGFIRVGLKSAVIKAFAVVVGLAGQADAQVPFADPNMEAAI